MTGGLMIIEISKINHNHQKLEHQLNVLGKKEQKNVRIQSKKH